MRVVGIVSKLAAPAGLYARDGVDLEKLTRRWDERVTAITMASSTPGVGAAQTWEVARMAWLLPLAISVPGGLALAGAYLAWRGKTPPPLSPLRRVPKARLPSDAEASSLLPSKVIVLPAPAMAGRYDDHGEPLFHGLFPERKLLQKVMEDEGGTGELHIVTQETANALYTHPGRGKFGRGLHVPHPKDPRVLLPIERYHDFIREELIHEWVSVFEALGAKLIVIGDTVEAEARAAAYHANPAMGIQGEFTARYGTKNVNTSTFERGTFDPARARAGRRWLGDHPEITSIVEGRIAGKQSSWRKSLQTNLAVGASVDVLVLAAPSVSGGSVEARFQRTWDFYVEFHPKV